MSPPKRITAASMMRNALIRSVLIKYKIRNPCQKNSNAHHYRKLLIATIYIGNFHFGENLLITRFLPFNGPFSLGKIPKYIWKYFIVLLGFSVLLLLIYIFILQNQSSHEANHS